MKNVPDNVVTMIAEALWPWPSPTPVWCRTQAYALLANPEAVAAIVEFNQPVKEQQHVASD